MQNWVRFCEIKKINYKTKNLVVGLSTRFFFDEIFLKKLRNIKLSLVPPVNDILREYTLIKVENINKQKNTFELVIDEKFEINLTHNAKRFFFLVCNDDIEKFTEKTNFVIDKNYILGKLVIDKTQGELGIVKDISGTEYQKHLVVKNKENFNILIPYVDELVINVDKHKIDVDLPEGLTNLYTK